MSRNPPATVNELLDLATDAVTARQPSRAFELLWQAELEHHKPSNQPPPAGEENKLMATWRLFGAILPKQL